MLNFSKVMSTIYCTIFSFFFILIIARMLGKKQLSQLTFFNYVTGITLGSIIADTVNIDKTSFVDNYIAIIVWTLLTILVGIIALKSPFLRVIIDGEPSIVIKRGKIQYKELNKVHLNIDDLTMLLRNKDVFNIKDVMYAILEPDGKLSVLKKESNKTITKKDMNINTKEIEILPSEIIVDGKLIKKNLKELDITEEWVINELNKQKIHSYKDVLYAEIQGDKTLYVDKK